MFFFGVPIVVVSLAIYNRLQIVFICLFFRVSFNNKKKSQTYHLKLFLPTFHLHSFFIRSTSAS